MTDLSPRPLPDDILEELQRLAERRLSKEEFEAYVAAPMSEAERDEIISLFDWYTRRFPMPLARLRDARRARDRWTRRGRGG